MSVINPNTAGIDFGSRSHFVAIGQGEKDFPDFGVCAKDLTATVKCLLDNHVTTVAMESQ